MQIITVGLDIAKDVFPVHGVDVHGVDAHGVDAHGEVVLRKRLARAKGAGVLRQPAALPDRHGGAFVGGASCACPGTRRG
jgi:hypothetical protein